MKGFRVVTCGWNRPEVTRAQLELIETFRVNSTGMMRDRHYGYMQTIWTPAGSFLDLYYGKNVSEGRMGQADSFREMIQFLNPGE
jgi:hypothetical protein